MEEHHNGGKMQGSTKGFIAILVVIAIVVPILLGAALVEGLPYSLPTPQAPSQTTTTGTSVSNVIVIPQGAGGAQKLNFSPSTLTVPSGTTLTFMDEDNSAPHNVYFLSVPPGATNPNGSGPPILTQGKSYNVTLTTPGTYTYECQFHPAWMQGTIIVTG